MTEFFKSEVIRVRTPDGTLFAIIMENDDGSPREVQLSFGKAGTALAAWAFSLAGLITMNLQAGMPLEKIIDVLGGITSDKSARIIGNNCRSGPEGVWMALMRYRQSKFQQVAESLNEPRENYRGASVAPWARLRTRG